MSQPSPIAAQSKAAKAPVLRVQNLRKHYGGVEAVKGISFQVHPGEIVGLLGVNGAGKTTTISMLLGVLEPTSGSIEIDSIDLLRQRSRALASTNFAAVYAPLPGNLTVYQNLRVFALLYGVSNFAARLHWVLDLFDLHRFRDTKCGLLSSGEQTRVGLAKALLSRPQVLLLDEPTASIDPANAREIRATIRSFATEAESGVLWTSHNMYEVEEVCSRVLFLSCGQIILEGDPRQLPSERGKPTLEELFISVSSEAHTMDQIRGAVPQ
ncbi:MAG: ABC transporter ATP-binding protein [Acidobacteriaceae bacterium]